MGDRDLAYKSIDQIPASTTAPVAGDWRLFFDVSDGEWKKVDVSTGDMIFDEVTIQDLTVAATATFAGATVADLGTVTAATFAGGTIASLGTVSAATAITTTAMTVGTRPLGRIPVALDATDAITVAEHANRILYTTTAATLTWTLPAATGTGNYYTFLQGILATGSKIIVTSETTNHRFIGGITVADGDTLFLPAAFKPGASDDTITLNGGTTGGELGDWVTVTDVATNRWLVAGAAQTQTGETPTTPFSNT